MNTEKHVVCTFDSEVTTPVALIEECLEISWSDVKSFSYFLDSLKLEMQNGDTLYYCLADDVRYMTETARSVKIEDI